MRLFLTGAGVAVFAFCSAAAAFAYDYPVVGDYNQNYQKVFDGIKAGKCTSMDDDLKALSASEGISPDIYRAICFFENKDSDKGYAVLSSMLNNQQYDEVLYICGTLDKKGDKDPRTLKYRGLAYQNIGDSESAARDMSAYLAVQNDDELRKDYVDVLISMKRYDDASAELEKLTVKDGGYGYRAGSIALKQGKVVSALTALRTVPAGDKENYPAARLMIADICKATGRFICAGKELNNNITSKGYADVVSGRKEQLEKAKKPFSAFIAFSEEYDNNVTSIDQDQLNGVSEKASFRSALAADLKYNIYPSMADKMSFGLLNYKSWNYSESDYNVETHQAYFMINQGYDKYDIMLPKITAGVTYLGGEKYSENFSLESSVSYKMDDTVITVPILFEKRNYFSEVSLPAEDRDGWHYSVSANALHAINQSYAAKAYAGYDIESTAGTEKDSRGYKFGLGGIYSYSSDLSFELDADYAYYDYNHSITDRTDDYFSTNLMAMYRLTDAIFLSGGVTWSKTDSSVNAYDYKKTVLNTTVGYNF